ncbi:tetratricopeptide repeat protein [Gemmatimonadota bacterium]
MTRWAFYYSYTSISGKISTTMIGTTIGRYTIIDRLGEGGMGTVWMAEDTTLGRKVALKFLQEESSSEEVQARFVREAKAASALDHPNICTVYEIDETDDGRIYISMAYCEGETVSEKIAAGPLKLPDALDIAIQIGRGLARAHTEGIVHRDIKPGNTIVTLDDTVKIVDFGLAKLSGATQLTRTGMMMGTAAYMSPEQIRGEAVDHRTDIWALGVVLYEMLVGRPPFESEHEQGVALAIISNEPEPVTAQRARLPMDLERVLAKALQKNPAERYQHIDDMLVDLEAIQREVNQPTTTRLAARESLPKGILVRRRRRPAALIAGASVILALILAIAFFGTGQIYINPKSVAVLHLRNLGDPADDYLAYGLTEGIIVDLQRASHYWVPPMQDVLPYKDSSLSTSDLARELRVRNLLSGSMLSTGNILKCSVQLVQVARRPRNLGAIHVEEPASELPTFKGRIIFEALQALGIDAASFRRRQVEQAYIPDPVAYDYYLQGLYRYDHRESEADLEVARSLFVQALDIDSNFVIPRYKLGESYRATGDYERALTIFQEALTIAEQNGSLFNRAIVMNGMAGVYFGQEDYDQSLEYMNQSIEIIGEAGDKVWQARAYGNLGSIYYYTEDHEKALENWTISLEIAREIDNKVSESTSLNNFGYYYLEEGDYDLALSYIEQVLSISGKINDTYGVALAHSIIGQIYGATGDSKRALRHYREAVSTFESINVRNFDDALAGIINVSIDISDTTSALEAIEQLGNLADENTGAERIGMLWTAVTYLDSLDRSDESMLVLEKAHTALMDLLGDSSEREQTAILEENEIYGKIKSEYERRR